MAQPNPNSAAIWHYAWYDENGNGKVEFEETMHRTCGTAVDQGRPAVHRRLQRPVPLPGCQDRQGPLDARHAGRLLGSPLIVEDKVYIGDEDGDICVFELSPEQELLAEINMGSSVYSTPVVANNVLFIANKDHCSRSKRRTEKKAIEQRQLKWNLSCLKRRVEHRPVQRRSRGDLVACEAATSVPQCVSADTADDALAALGREKFDLVMVNRKLDADYSDGLEIIRRIKADPQVGRHPLHAGDQLSPSISKRPWPPAPSPASASWHTTSRKRTSELAKFLG